MYRGAVFDIVLFSRPILGGKQNEDTNNLKTLGIRLVSLVNFREVNMIIIKQDAKLML